MDGINRSLPGQETGIVYKRNSAWWFATCYLLGSFFLLLLTVILLFGSVLWLGKEGVVALKQASDEQAVERAISGAVRDHIKLAGFKVTSRLDMATLSVSIRNESKYAIEDVKVEIAHLDANGSPVFVRDEPLRDLRTIFPGDTAHSQIDFQLRPEYQDSSYSVRISGFKVMGDAVLKEFCKQPQP